MSRTKRRWWLVAACLVVALGLWAVGPVAYVYRFRLHNRLADEVAVEYSQLKTRCPPEVDPWLWGQLCDLSLTARSNALFAPSTTPFEAYRRFVDHLRGVARSPAPPTLLTIPDLWDEMANVSPAAARYREQFRPLFDERLAYVALSTWARSCATRPRGEGSPPGLDTEAYRLLVVCGDNAIPTLFTQPGTERVPAEGFPWHLAVEEILDHRPTGVSDDLLERRVLWHRWWRTKGHDKDWHSNLKPPKWRESLELP
jgi:hypothetical protein